MQKPDRDGKVLKRLKAKLDVAPNCPFGEHLLTVRTAHFLADPVPFFVGLLPVVPAATQKHTTPETAQTVPLNSSVHGDCGRERRDFYAFEAKKEQRLSLELDSAGLMGGGDCYLRLTGPDGKVLGASDDTALLIQDPLLSLRAPQDGRYVVEVAAAPGGGGRYQLHVGTFPRPTSVYPLGGRPGEKLGVILQKDGLGAKNAAVVLPATKGRPGPLEMFDYWPEENGQVAPSPLHLRVTSHPNLMEAEPNDTMEKAPTAPVPAALNGVIQKAGDVDLWRFHAEKGQAIDIRVFAAMLGSPLDAKLWIRPARAPKEDELPLVEVDDSAPAARGYFMGFGNAQMRGGPDPAVTFRPKESGDFVLGIEDTRGLGGTDFVYRLEMDTHVDSVGIAPATFYLKEGPRYESIQIPQGNQWTTTFRMVEGLGTTLKGEYMVEVLGLPPGVKAISCKVTSQSKDFPVQFVAQTNAKPCTAFIQVVLHPEDKATQLETFSARRWNFTHQSLWVDSIPLAVVESAPFHLELDQSPAGLSRSGELDLTARVIRHGNWNGPVEVKFDWVPPGVDQLGAIEVPPGKTEVKIALRAKRDALLGAWRVSLLGTTTEQGTVRVGGRGCILVASPFVELNVTDPFVEVTLQRASVEKGGKGQILADLKQLQPFTGKARATLNRLPNGVRLLEPFPEISASDKTCAFQIEATHDALVGQYKEIQAEVAVKEAGQIIRQQSGSGVLRVDPTRGATK